MASPEHPSYEQQYEQAVSNANAWRGGAIASAIMAVAMVLGLFVLDWKVFLVPMVACFVVHAYCKRHEYSEEVRAVHLHIRALEEDDEQQ